VASSKPSNVVPLNERANERAPARAAGGAGETFSLARECREFALVRISTALRAVLGKVEQDLFELGYNATDRDLRNQYFEARDETRANVQAFCNALEREFLTQFNDKARREAKRRPAGQSMGDTMELSLLEEGALEDNIALGNLVGKLREINKDSLYALTRRMAVVLQNPQLEDADNPLGPETIGAAVKQGLDALKIGRQAKPGVVKLIEQYMIDEVETIYNDLNDLLIQRNILPQVRLGTRKVQQSAGGVPATPAAAAPAQAPGGDAKDWFALLQRLVGGVRGPGVDAVAGNTQWPVMPPTEASLAAMASLTKLQQGRIEALGNAVRGFDASALASGRANVLHEIKSTEIAAGFGQMDAMTIDIVAMLFDYVFDDKRIPDAIKALIGRLQIPILKVAILDKKFFSNKTHPARKLLDSLAAAAVGWTGAADATDPLYGKIDSIVQRVITSFESELGLFDGLVGELEEFLAEEDQRLSAFSEQSARVVHDRERVEIARVVASDEVQRRTDTREMPEPVRAFLEAVWEKALVVSYAAHGEGSERWAITLGTMDDLIWSVAPKETGEDRKKLVSLLPELLKRLHAGMDLVALPPESRNQFFAELVRCHAQAVKSGLATSSAPVAPPPAQLQVVGRARPRARAPIEEAPVEPQDVWAEGATEDAPQLVATQVNQGDVLIEEIKLQGVHDFETDDPRQKWDNLVASLVRGMWVQFLQKNGATIRAKLTWISPLKGIYLFSNPNGARALAFEPKALAEAFRRGRAEVISDSPLVESAMNSMVSSMKESAPAH
jgi:hypothetical protein